MCCFLENKNERKDKHLLEYVVMDSSCLGLIFLFCIFLLLFSLQWMGFLFIHALQA